MAAHSTPGFSDPGWLPAFEALADVVLALDHDVGVVRRQVSPLASPNVPSQDAGDTRMLARIHPEDISAALAAWREVAGHDQRRVSLDARLRDLVDPDVWMGVKLMLVGVEPRPDGVVALLSARFANGVPLDLHAVESDGFSVAASAPVGLALYTESSVVAWANPLFVEMVGRDSGPTSHSERCDHPVFGVIEQLAESWGSPEVDAVDPAMVLLRGRTLRVDARPSGNAGDLLVSLQDISEQMEASAARSRAEATFAAAFDHSLAGIAVLTLSGAFRQVNKAFADIAGYREAELLGRPFAMVTHPDDLLADERQVAELLAGEREHYQMEKRCVRSDGDVVWVDLRVAMVRDVAGRPLQLVANAVDISDRLRAEASLRAQNSELTHRAGHDDLTGLPNRRMLEEYLEDLRGGLIDGVFAFVCDVDRFKRVNDAHGHQAGDEVLQEIANRLRNGSREGDLVARIGGDEFVVFAQLGGDPELAVHLGERLVSAVRRPIVVDDEQVSVGLSVGISRMQPHIDISESIQLADRAALQVKREGGGARLATI